MTKPKRKPRKPFGKWPHQIATRVDEDTYHAIEQECIRRQVGISQILREILREILQQHYKEARSDT